MRCASSGGCDFIRGGGRSRNRRSVWSVDTEPRRSRRAAPRGLKAAAQASIELHPEYISLAQRRLDGG